MLMTVGLVGNLFSFFLFFFFEKLVGNLRHLDSNSKPFILKKLEKKIHGSFRRKYPRCYEFLQETH